MSKRFDNRRILYILAGLVVILALTILLKVPGERATIKEQLVEIDTARVNRIIIYPKISEGSQFEFIRKNGTWIIQRDNIIAMPERDAVKRILMEVRSIRPKSLEAVDKSKWNDFNLTDSLATRVKFLDAKGKNLGDMMIGRFTYSRSNNPYANPNGNGIEGISFVRLHDDVRVYSVEGFLSLSFSGKFNDYRDKSFLKLKKEDVTKISLKLPADSSFILNKKDSVWLDAGHIADSAAVAGYLNILADLNGQDFKDNIKPVSNPEYELSIEGNNLINISVKCYKGENDNEYILNSSLNPEIYFTSRNDGIFGKLFRSEKYFLMKSSKQVRR
jgi:hypothetical protein